MNAIISVVLAFIYIITKRNLLPEHVLNGFALLAIVGALFRLLPFTEEKGFAQPDTTPENQGGAAMPD